MGRTVQFLIQHGYVLLFFWILAEQAALPVPSLPLLLACGALARVDKMDLRLVLLYGLAACLIADNVWFQLGKRRGAKILHFICRIALEPDSCVRLTENAFVKYGLRSLLVAKFVPGLNAVAAPLAGSSGARLELFLMYDCLGALIWIGTCTCIGYVAGDQIELVAEYAMRMGSWLGLLIVGLLAAWIGWKFVQRRRFVRKLTVARITAGELRDKLRAGEKVFIIDVRSSLDNEMSAIPEALRISLDQLATRHLEIPRDRDIVLFCT
jgi:membrane protein DedA with SNARE-associated domain